MEKKPVCGRPAKIRNRWDLDTELEHILEQKESKKPGGASHTAGQPRETIHNRFEG